MAQVVIENPVLNSPYDEPTRHFYFDDDGITDKIVESQRRLSSYFVPMAKPKKKGKQLELDTEWTKDRIEENKFINDVRRIVSKWRLSNYDGVTTVTRQGSTRFVDFDTSRAVYATREDRCHISHVVADTDSWEQKMAQTLESLDQVASYFKNHNVGFTIPYTLNGQERNFVPDFVAKLRTATGEVNLIIEVTGEKRADKEAKVATARTLWVPAVNNHGGFGRWAFVEIADPWAAKAELLAAAAAVTDNGVGAKGGGRQ